jgi:transglutaminase-like putative cysteine protease
MATQPVPRSLLHGLLLVLGLVVAPHAANLNPWILGFFYAALAWRALAQARPATLPGRWLLLLLMAAAAALVVFTSDLRDGRLAGTGLLVVMLGLKLLESRARRDVHIALYLGYFVALTQFLYDQSLGLALYLFAGVAALLTLQIALNRVTVEWRRQAWHMAALLGAAVPLALVVFVLFPRLPTPLWGIQTQSAVSGISDEMTLGNIGRLSRSSATAFRVQFFGDAPPPQARYWRGPVLWYTDGRRWTAGRHLVRAFEPPTPGLPAVEYEVTLEPTGEFWLFGLDVVSRRPAGGLLNSNYSLVGQQRVHRRLSYRAASDPDYVIGEISARERDLGLQLPLQVSERVEGLVREWQRQTAGNPDPFALIDRALAYFGEQPFVYTLNPGTLENDAIDRFLFETRRGFCEHYAGSFALLMRLAGIPSRVVIGYQGGERNPHADHWVVRQSDAHAWVEVWVDGVGWSRVDPTAAVAPERVEQPIDASLSEDSGRVVFNTGDFGLLRSAWLNAVWMADAVELGWHRWVVGFTTDRQSSLLSALGLGSLQGYWLSISLVIGGGVATAFVYLLAKLPRPRRHDPLPALWRQFTAKLQRRGLRPAPWQGPDTVCAAAGASFPAARDQIVAINRLYVQLRYGKGQDARQLDALRRRIRQLRL